MTEAELRCTRGNGEGRSRRALEKTLTHMRQQTTGGVLSTSRT